jgi:hypothetical protein
MYSSLYEICLLVDNKPIEEYQHNGRTFVEGRNGSEYKIRIKNNDSARICFVVSVDGLSIIDGKECASTSPGYLLNPLQTLDIACYKVDDKTGAKFVFGSKEKSYSAEIGKGTDNVGVIGGMVYRDQFKPILVQKMPRTFDGTAVQHNWNTFQSSVGPGWWGGSATAIGGAAPTSTTGWSTNLGAQALYTNTSVGDAVTQGMPAEEQLGTMFGDAMQWQTQTVAFDREFSPRATFEIFYDSRKNLERRGIKFEHKLPPLPNAFPGNPGCAPPSGWKR